MPSQTTAKSVILNRSIFHELAEWAAESPHMLDQLFESEHAVQLVFRSLPPMARLYVTRLMYAPQDEANISVDSFRQCLRRRQRAKDRHDAAIRTLRALRVIVEAPTCNSSAERDSPSIQLNPVFAQNLRRSVTYQVPPVFGGPCDIDQVESAGAHYQSDTAALDQFASAKLERILNFLVESSGMSTPGGNIVKALIQTGILEQKREGLCISSAGFQFLLKDSFAQLWLLIRSIIRTHYAEKKFDAFNLIFKLAFSCPARLYRDPSLSESQIELIGELHELGIVQLEDDISFRPTPIGVRLLSSANRVSTGQSAVPDAPTTIKTTGEIEIFVETNFRVYAYTTSTFQTNLLGLFTHLRYKLPCMVVGHLTRDAVRKALMNGITGDQIIGYLNTHAHPRMKRGCIPPNVSDEIRLWEAEQDRVQTRPGVLLSDFESETSFKRVVSYANDMGALLWSHATKKLLFVSREGYDSVKNFIKRHGV